jgi:hypothetical protein
MACTNPSCGTQESPSTFLGYYQPLAEYASNLLQWPLALIVTEWYEESGDGASNICQPYNNPANYGGSGPANPYPTICVGVSNGYIAPMLYPFFFAVSASDANGRSAQQYVRDAFLNGYTVPPSNGYGSVPGAGYQFAAGFEAACAAMGAMGWAQSNYYVSGDSPNTAGNILINWYNDYFTSISNTEISSAGCPC